MPSVPSLKASYCQTLVHLGTLNIPEATYIVYGPLRTINYVFTHALTASVRPSKSASVSYCPLYLILIILSTLYIPLGRTQTLSTIYSPQVGPLTRVRGRGALK